MISSQKRVIISQCEYGIEYYTAIKKQLLDLGNQKAEISWAIGGLIASISTTMLKVCHQVIEEIPKDDTQHKASADIREIQRRFNLFIDKMLEGEE